MLFWFLTISLIIGWAVVVFLWWLVITDEGPEVEDFLGATISAIFLVWAGTWIYCLWYENRYVGPEPRIDAPALSTPATPRPAAEMESA